MKFIEKLLSRNSYDIGKQAENEAVKILKRMKYEIIARNFYTRLGEIDIVARDGEYICFVEVRMRKNNKFGSPADTIDIHKQRKIINTAKVYAAKNGIYDTPMRFDAVLINGDTEHGKLHNIKAEVIKDAFRL